MRRTGICIAVTAALLVMAAPAISAPTLRGSDARTEATLMASTFTLRHRLDESHVGHCRRRSSRMVLCRAKAKGETRHMTKVCRLRIRVRAVAHRFYTDDIASITRHRCSKTIKERLRYAEAFPAMQAAADAFAGASTSITYVSRRDDLTYTATAKWERPALHPTEWFPTESCRVDIIATLTDDRISTETEGFSCY